MSEEILQTPNLENRPNALVTLRTLKTNSGADFDVFSETEHYVMCHEPRKNVVVSQVLFDFEDLAQQGYFLCNHHIGPGGFLIFEKRFKHEVNE